MSVIANNKFYIASIGWISILCLLLGSCGKQEAKPVTLTVSAGGSLKSAMLEINKIYTQQKPHVTITYNFGGAGNLQEAIERRENIDIFLTGGIKIMDDLQSKGFVLTDTRRNILSNRMVLIVPKDTANISNFKDLTNESVKKVAIPNPKNAVSGKYSVEILAYLGILERIKPKFVFTPGAVSSDAVKFVESGKADAGITYATDAILSNKVRVVAIAPLDSYTQSAYSVAVLKNSKNIPEAKEFVQFLQSDRAGATFVKYGFTLYNNTSDR